VPVTGLGRSPEIVIGDVAALGEELARRFERAAGAAIAARGRFAFALPGGSVAARFFPRLAVAAVDWTRVDVFWVDERAVPPSDPESNYGLAARLWLEPAAVPAERVHRLPGEAADLTAAAVAYGQLLDRSLAAAPLDLVLLGTGPDGHVASLFPGHQALAERSASVVAVVDAPKPPPRRLTLTTNVLAAARELVVVALGSEKARVLRAALVDGDGSLPLTHVLAAASGACVLLDPAAAEGLTATLAPALRWLAPP
jgi:6-phosphogluconolactonase